MQLMNFEKSKEPSIPTGTFNYLNLNNAKTNH